MKDSLLLYNLNIHNDWFPFLEEGNLQLILDIEKEIKDAEFTPEAGLVLRFLSQPLKTVKIIILG